MYIYTYIYIYIYIYLYIVVKVNQSPPELSYGSSRYSTLETRLLYCNKSFAPHHTVLNTVHCYRSHT